MPEDKEFERLRKMEEALERYTSAMHDYTLQLWTECKKRAEGRLGRGAGGDHGKRSTSRGKSREKAVSGETRQDQPRV